MVAKTSIWLWLFLVSVVCVSAWGCADKKIRTIEQLRMKSLAELELQIARALPKPEVVRTGAFPSEALLANPSAKEIRDRGTWELLSEMLRQGDFPYVKLVAFYCMKEKWAERVFEGSLIAVLRNEGTWLILEPIINAISEERDKKGNKEVLGAVLANSGTERGNAVVLVGALGDEFIAHWIEEVEIDAFDPDLQALFVDAAYRYHKENGTEPASSVRRMLRGLYKYPDLRRVVFVCNSRPEDDNFDSTLVNLIKDRKMEASEIIPAIAVQAEYIRQEVDYHSMGLSKERVRLIDEILEIELDMNR